MVSICSTVVASIHAQLLRLDLAWVNGVAGARTRSRAVAGELAITMPMALSQQSRASRMAASAQHQGTESVMDAFSANSAQVKLVSTAPDVAAASTCSTTIAGTTAEQRMCRPVLWRTTQGTTVASAVLRSHALTGQIQMVFVASATALLVGTTAPRATSM